MTIEPLAPRPSPPISVPTDAPAHSPALIPHEAHERGGSSRPPSGSFMHTLRWRLAVSYAAVVLLLLIVLGLVLNVVVTNIVYRNALSYFAQDTAAVIGTDTPNLTRDITGHVPDCAGTLTNQEAFDAAIAGPLLTSQIGIHQVLLVDPRSGYVLASGGGVTGERAPYFAPTLAATLATQVKDSAPLTQPKTDLPYTSYLANSKGGGRLGVSLIALRYPLTTACEKTKAAATGIVEVTTTLPRAEATTGTVRLMLVISILVAVLLALIAGPPLIARALAPLTRMNATARRIAAGDLSQRVALPHTNDEVGRLAATFDEMIARIETAFAAQQASEQRMRQFIADASHELRTPLTSIRGFTDVLLRGAKDDPETAEHVLLATQREAERMSRLVNDLLMLARLDAGRPLEKAPLDLIALVGEAVDQARLLAGVREVSWQTDGRGRLEVLGDADRLKQVVLILLDNALKYGRQGPDAWVRVGVGRDDSGRAIVYVSDNGPGIALADLPRVFDRFYRAERAAHQRRISGAPGGTYPRPSDPDHPEHPDHPRAEIGAGSQTGQSGSGLGLAIARAIVQAHAGTLTVESQVGAGTTFTLTLPMR